MPTRSAMLLAVHLPTYPSAKVLTKELRLPRAWAQIMGFDAIAETLGRLAVPMANGEVVDAYGSGASFCCMAGLVLVAAIVSISLWPHSRTCAVMPTISVTCSSRI